MARPAITYVDTYQLSAGERLTAYPKVRGEAEGRGLADLTAALDRWVAFDDALYKDEVSWEQRKKYLVAHGPEARDLDQQLDALLGSLEASLQAQTRLARFKPERAAHAARLIETLFPGGLASITQASFSDQAHRTRHLIEAIREEAAHVALMESLGLMEVVDEIARLNEAYSEAVGAGERASREELDARRQQGLEGLGEIIARILGAYPTESAEDKQGREALFAPIAWQNSLLKVAFRERRRGAPTPTSPESPDFIGPVKDAAA